MRVNDVIHLRNAYANGSFLETNSTTTATGNLYDVCTNAYWNRAAGVANWRLIKA